MSESLNSSPATTTPAAPSVPTGFDYLTLGKWAAAVALMASVFAVDYFGLKAPNFLPLATSALAVLLGHTAAKTLN